MEALVGDPKRIALVAADLVAHSEKRVEAMDGKAMIVCMSRRIYVDLFNALIKLRSKREAETLKIVIKGRADTAPTGRITMATETEASSAPAQRGPPEMNMGLAEVGDSEP